MADEFVAPALTPRESLILHLLSQGHSAKIIARSLDSAPRTVEKHIDNMKLKLRARNRSHMIALAHGAALIPLRNDGLAA